MIKVKEELLWDEVAKLKEWREAQNALCNQHIITYEREHEKLKGEMTAYYVGKDEQYKEILRRLDKIEKIIERRHT